MLFRGNVNFYNKFYRGGLHIFIEFPMRENIRGVIRYSWRLAETFSWIDFDMIHDNTPKLLFFKLSRSTKNSVLQGLSHLQKMRTHWMNRSWVSLLHNSILRLSILTAKLQRIYSSWEWFKPYSPFHIARNQTFIGVYNREILRLELPHPFPQTSKLCKM